MARQKKADQEPPPNYRAWICPSCGEGVEAIEIFRGLGKVYEKAQKEALELRQARQQGANQP